MFNEKILISEIWVNGFRIEKKILVGELLFNHLKDVCYKCVTA
jgi:hypothetical protein